MEDINRQLPKKERKPKPSADEKRPSSLPESHGEKASIGIGFNVDVTPEKLLPYNTQPQKEILTEEFVPIKVHEEPDPKIISKKKVHVKKVGIRKRILLWARDIGIAFLVAVLIMQFIRPTIVQQHSMEDTLHENDYIFLNRQAYNFGEIAHGDIFVFKYDPPLGSPDNNRNLIKRVIGLPGDVVSIENGNVYVNSEVIDDSYTKDGYTDGYMDPMRIPEGYIFAMGDNRQNSFDSRDPMLGLIDMRNVIGKAIFRVFPINKAGFVS